MLHKDFMNLYDEALNARYEQYWKNPRRNCAGGVEHPSDRQVNAWKIQAFKEAAEKLGCRIRESVQRDIVNIVGGVGDCYPLVRLVADHPKHGFIAGLEYVNCVCGDHGPRNARLFWPRGQWTGVVR